MMPRGSLADDCPWCPAKAGETCQRYEYDHPGHPREKGAEPQAGAQVPSLDEIPDKWRTFYGEICIVNRHFPTAKNPAQFIIEDLAKALTNLNTIRNYAREAAKTPIAREDMHDPLKAQTFFDEAKGFERLVLSEIGGSK